jgi:hypothetical protein
MSREILTNANTAVGLFSSRRELSARRTAAGSKTKTTLIAIFSLAVPQPVWAGTSTPNTPPAAPAAYVTNTGTLSTVGSGGCSQQYNPAIASFVDQQLIAQATQLAADVGGTTAKITAETATQIAAAAKVTAAATKQRQTWTSLQVLRKRQ